MDLKEIDLIKRLTVIALFSNDDLMNKLVLKGGNAMNLIYKLSGRASFDLDFSINNDFNREEIGIIEEKINKGLIDTFKAYGYIVFDFNIFEKPKQRGDDELDNFWGGYKIEFKTISKDKFDNLNGNVEKIRLESIAFTEKQNKKIFIDISKFEYTASKIEKELDSYTIYVYSPEMIIFEKLRAICQQMPEYAKIVKSSSQSARARDFYDIYLIVTKFEINVLSPENVNLMKSIFEAKKVPLELISKIKNQREYHKPDFQSVVDTVSVGTELKEYDFYFDYVVDLFNF